MFYLKENKVPLKKKNLVDRDIYLLLTWQPQRVLFMFQVSKQGELQLNFCAVVQRYGLSINRKTSSVFINVCPLSTTKKCHAVSLCAYPLAYTVVSSIRWVNSCMGSPLAGTKLCDCAIYLVLTTFHEEPTSFKSLPPPPTFLN